MSATNEGGAFFAGLVIGGLVGAALALLLAPQSGEETRAIIRDKSLEYKDWAEEGYVEARQRASDAGHYAHDQATVLGEKSKSAYEKSAKKASDAVEKGKQTISKSSSVTNDGAIETDVSG